MDKDLRDRIQEALEWCENGPEPSPENIVPAEIYCIKRAARDLNRLRIDHADTTKLAEAQSALALKISHARSWGITWQCVGEMIGTSAAEAEELFNNVKHCKSQNTYINIINSGYQGAECLKQTAENLLRIESNHASESEIAEAQIELIHRMSTATAWDIPWSRIGEIIGISGTEAEDLFDRITEAAETRADAMEAAAQAGPGRDQGLT